MDLKEYLKIEEIRTYSEVAKNELEYVARATKFFPKTSAISGEEGGEEADAGAPIGTVQDLMFEKQIYQWADIGFGE